MKPSIPSSLHCKLVHLLEHGRHHEALAQLTAIRDEDEQERAATMLAQLWGREDINAAWQAVSASSLSHALKQRLFNDLWTG